MHDNDIYVYTEVCPTLLMFGFLYPHAYMLIVTEAQFQTLRLQMHMIKSL
jgi:hypothetical protein